MHCKLTKLEVSEYHGYTQAKSSKVLDIKDFKDSHVEPQEFMLQRALHFAAQYIREGATEVRITSAQ